MSEFLSSQWIKLRVWIYSQGYKSSKKFPVETPWHLDFFKSLRNIYEYGFIDAYLEDNSWRDKHKLNYVVATCGSFEFDKGSREHKYKTVKSMTLLRGQELADKYRELMEAWIEETKDFDSLIDIFLNNNHFELIQLGPGVLPYLFHYLRFEEDIQHIFWIIQSLTKKDVVPISLKGDLESMKECWLEWSDTYTYNGFGEHTFQKRYARFLKG